MNEEEQDFLDFIKLKSKLMSRDIESISCHTCSAKIGECCNKYLFFPNRQEVIDFEIFEFIINNGNFITIQNFEESGINIDSNITICKNWEPISKKYMHKKCNNFRILDLNTDIFYRTYDEIMNLYKELKK